MSGRPLLVWSDELTGYDFGPGHPLAPVRVALAVELARQTGVLDRFAIEAPEPATEDQLLAVHEPGYLDAVRAAGAAPHRPPPPGHGLGPGDNPVFAGMHEAASLVVGASLAAARAVQEGRADHAANLAGGLHHAMADRASGFCVYNDPAAAIAWLLRAGAARVGYVDVDVHHGDGVQAAFYDDPRVLTVSIHESGHTLFPGTGFPTESGAAGTAVNVALPAGTGDAGWLRAFHAVVPPLLRAFRPEVLVTQQGCDTHLLDPLAHLTLSVDAQRASYAVLHGLAHELCDGRWVLLGGGGYEWVRVVPRAWTHLLAEASGTPLDPDTETPAAWRGYAGQRVADEPPRRMTDDAVVAFAAWEGGDGDPDDPVDRAVAATRHEVFAEHGLDPQWA